MIIMRDMGQEKKKEENNRKLMRRIQAIQSEKAARKKRNQRGVVKAEVPRVQERKTAVMITDSLKIQKKPNFSESP